MPSILSPLRISSLNLVKLATISSLRVGIDTNCRADTWSLMAPTMDWISLRASVIVASESPVITRLPLLGIDIVVFVLVSRIFRSQSGNLDSFE